ncbi:MAG: hypothetical protein LC746_13475, partial [Acidobacteria bacterium]|nr:hypothetical protein [Acidobacteriota bacterium]
MLETDLDLRPTNESVAMITSKTSGQDTSAKLFARAVELMPGGVNSPVRAFRGVGGTPRFIA